MVDGSSIVIAARGSGRLLRGAKRHRQTSKAYITACARQPLRRAAGITAWRVCGLLSASAWRIFWRASLASARRIDAVAKGINRHVRGKMKKR